MKKFLLIITMISILLVGCSTSSIDSASNNISTSNIENKNDNIEIDNSTNKVSIKNDNIKNNVNIQYIPYANPRFGFSIMYPDFLVNKFESDNGDGIELSNAEGTVKLVVSGINNTLENSPIQEFEEELKFYGNVSYKNLSGNNFVITGHDNDYIYYQYTVVGTGSINRFRIIYPNSQKDEFDEIIENLINSFDNPWIDEFR